MKRLSVSVKMRRFSAHCTNRPATEFREKMGREPMTGSVALARYKDILRRKHYLAKLEKNEEMDMAWFTCHLLGCVNNGWKCSQPNVSQHSKYKNYSQCVTASDISFAIMVLQFHKEKWATTDDEETEVEGDGNTKRKIAAKAGTKAKTTPASTTKQLQGQNDRASKRKTTNRLSHEERDNALKYYEKVLGELNEMEGPGRELDDWIRERLEKRMEDDAAPLKKKARTGTDNDGADKSVMGCGVVTGTRDNPFLKELNIEAV